MNRKERRRLEKETRKSTSASPAPLAGAPPSTAAMLNQALALHQAGRPKDAQGLYRKILAHRPDDADALGYSGLAAYQLGKPDEAIRLLQAAAAASPGDAHVLFNLGNVLRATGKTKEAVTFFQRAIAIEPANAEFHNNLGIALSEAGRPDDAVAAHRRALGIKPDYADAHMCLGIALKALGKAEEAEAAYRQAIKIKPDNPTAHLNLGNALKALGKFAEARSAYRRTIELQPDDAEAYQYLTSLKSHGSSDAEAEAMEKLAKDPAIGNEQAMWLGFALAKTYNDLGEYDRAFVHLTRANTLKRRSLQYEIAEEEAAAERIAAVFDEPFLQERAGQGCPSDVPIFIVGMPRSGTTLIEQILASHSRVYGADELTEMERIVDALGGAAKTGPGFPQSVAKLTARDLDRFGQTYVERVRQHAPDVAHVTDKMTLNFRFIGLIRLILPNARIINCVRDPIDTCLSCYQQLFTGDLKFTYDLAELGRYYRLYDRLMSHWRAVLPGVVFDIRYEDVIADQERWTRRLLEYCGLPWEDACLAFHETERAVYTVSSTQVRQPIFKDSIGRWKHYETHLAPLLEALGPLE